MHETLAKGALKRAQMCPFCKSQWETTFLRNLFSSMRLRRTCYETQYAADKMAKDYVYRPGMCQRGRQGGHMPLQILADQKAPPAAAARRHYFTSPQIFSLWDMPVFIVTFFRLVRNPIWSSLIHFGQIWSKKIKKQCSHFYPFCKCDNFLL